MKNFRKYSLVVLAILVLVGGLALYFPEQARADNVILNTGFDHETISEIEIELEFARQLEEYLMQITPDPQMRSSAFQTKSVRTHTGTSWSGARRASGQERCGRRGISSFVWSGTGGGTVSLSLRMPWGSMGVSLPTGNAFASVGSTTNVPASLRDANGNARVNVALYINQNVQGRRYRVYTRNSPTQAWRFHSTQDFSTVLSRTASVNATGC